MEIKMLELGDEELLLEFLQWLTPEALELWYFYGKQFDLEKTKGILQDFSSLKIAGLDKVINPITNETKERIVVFGHLYQFKGDSCRLGIVAGVVGKGYGSQMMKVLINYAQMANCKKICLSTYADNFPAIALYKKFGFQIIEEFSDKPRKKFEMELNLEDKL